MTIRLAANSDRKIDGWLIRTMAHRGALLAGLVGTAVLLAVLSLRWSVLISAAVFTAILMLVRPGVALVVLAVAIPFGSLAPLPVAGANGVDVLVFVSVATWLAWGCATRKITLRLPPLSWPLLIFIWIAGWSLTQALSWREGVPELLKWSEFAAVYLVAAQVLTPSTRRWVVVALLGAGVMQAILGAYQFFWQVGPDPFIVLGRYLRAYGTFRQPNPYAGYLGYLFPVALSLALGAAWRWWQGRQRQMLWLGLGALVLAAALAAGIGMSWSRGAWLGLAAATITVLGLRNRRTAALTVTIVTLFILMNVFFSIAWLPDPIEDRLSDLGAYIGGPDPARTEITDANFSVLERLAHWRAGLAMFADYPWLGVGIGNFAIRYPQYALPHWYDPLGHAHNVAINFLAETGALGAGAFGAFWFGIFWLTYRKAAQQSGIEAALVIGILGTWAYLTVHSMFDNLFVQHMQLQLALLLGVIVTGETKEPGITLRDF